MAIKDYRFRMKTGADIMIEAEDMEETRDAKSGTSLYILKRDGQDVGRINGSEVTGWWIEQ